MAMDEDRIKKLRSMVESGEMSEDLFDEIMERWHVNDSENEKIDMGNPKEEPKIPRSKKIKVSGRGQLSTVYSEELSVSGSLAIEGSVDSNNIDINGSCKVEEDVISSGTIDSSGFISIGRDLFAKDIDCSGGLKVDGKIEAGDIDSSGSLRASSVKCENFDSSGSTRIDEVLHCKTMDTSGKTKAKAVECEIMKSSGLIDVEIVTAEEIYIAGRIDANEIHARRFEMEINNSTSRIEKLEADAIEVRPARKKFISGSAIINEITCKRAYLESTISKTVRGDDITIGNDCDIDYVEAKALKISDKARVKEKKIIQ